jgi:molybdopterin converting factor small subunit
MRVQIRLGEPFWRTVGQRDLMLNLNSGANVGQLLTQLYKDFPALKKELLETPPYIFVGDEQADETTPLADSCRVHLVWAVAGGTGGHNNSQVI